MTIRGKKLPVQRQSNEEIMHNSLARHGHVRLRISFSVENIPLNGMDIVIQVRSPGLVKEIARLILETIEKC